MLLFGIQTRAEGAMSEAAVDWETTVETARFTIHLVDRDASENSYKINRQSGPATVRDIALFAYFNYRMLTPKMDCFIEPKKVMVIAGYDSEKRWIRFRFK